MASGYSEGNCNFCEESRLEVGQKTNYGATVIYRIGGSEDGWFATLSPKTGGNPEKDFSIQLIPVKHLKHFSDLNSNKDSAKNYGLASAKLPFAITEILKEQNIKEGLNHNILPIGIYGKCKHEDEHIHIRLFPYRGDIGQPFTVDSSFEKKQTHIDKETGERFVKMIPITKVKLTKERFDYLSKRLIELLNQD